jgi:hypothetical protein
VPAHPLEPLAEGTCFSQNLKFTGLSQNLGQLYARIGILSQTAGPACEFWINPVNFTVRYEDAGLNAGLVEREMTEYTCFLVEQDILAYMYDAVHSDAFPIRVEWVTAWETGKSSHRLWSHLDAHYFISLVIIHTE